MISSLRVSIFFVFMLAGSLHAATITLIDDSNHQKIFDITKMDYSLTPIQTIPLANGVIKKKCTELYKQIPILNSLITYTDKGVKIPATHWYGYLITDIEKDLQNVDPSISKEQALTLIKKKFSPYSNDLITHEKAELMIRLNDNNQAELIYLVSMHIEGKKLQRPYGMVNAKTGNIIRSWDGLARFDLEKGSGLGGNGKIGKYVFGKDFDYLFLFHLPNGCVMANDKVAVYDMGNKSSGGIIPPFTCPVNVCQPTNGAFCPLNDALYYGTKVVEMYQKWSVSSDWPEKPIKIQVHYSTPTDPYWDFWAFWDGEYVSLSDGDETNYYPMTAVDVIGHEISHAFTEKHSQLFYFGQAAGINESFSDIAGETAKWYVNVPFQRKNDWRFGDAVKKDTNSAIRYFIDPAEGGAISNLFEYAEDLTPQVASGLFDNAFYLIATYGDWNPRTAFQLFLVANQVYWTPEETFEGAANTLCRAAKDLFGDTSDKTALIYAFHHVGLNNIPQCWS